MRIVLAAIGLLTVALPCTAITPAVAPPPVANVAPPRPMTVQAAKAMRDDSSGLRSGTIEGLSVTRGTFQVHGQSLTFDPKKVRLYGRDGKPTSVYALRSGAKVRFTLDSADPKHRRAAVIYVD